MTDDTFYINFCDLKEECQDALLEFYGINTPEEANFDMIPIAEIPKPEEKRMYKCRVCGEKKEMDYCCDHNISICLDCCDDGCDSSVKEWGESSRYQEKGGDDGSET